MLQTTLKVRRLEADNERMTEALTLIATMGEDRPPHLTHEQWLSEIARLARAALVSATPADPRLALSET